MIFNKRDFEDLIFKLGPEDYKYKGNFGSARFIKVEGNIIFTIAIGYGEYFPHSAIISGVSADVYFNEVEDILNSLKKKYYPNKHFGGSTIQKVFVKQEGVDYTKFDTEIKDETTFKLVVTEIEKIIYYGALPFFERYSKLTTVFEEIEKMTIEEMVNIIVQPLPQRRMVIKWLCNDANYREYVDMVIDFYKTENEENWKEIELLDGFLKSIE